MARESCKVGRCIVVRGTVGKRKAKKPKRPKQKKRAPARRKRAAVAGSWWGAVTKATRAGVDRVRSLVRGEEVRAPVRRDVAQQIAAAYDDEGDRFWANTWRKKVAWVDVRRNTPEDMRLVHPGRVGSFPWLALLVTSGGRVVLTRQERRRSDAVREAREWGADMSRAKPLPQRRPLSDLAFEL